MLTDQKLYSDIVTACSDYGNNNGKAQSSS